METNIACIKIKAFREPALMVDFGNYISLMEELLPPWKTAGEAVISTSSKVK